MEKKERGEKDDWKAEEGEKKRKVVVREGDLRISYTKEGKRRGEGGEGRDGSKKARCKIKIK